MLQCWYRTRAMRGRRAFPYRDLRSQSPRTRVASEAHLLARGVPAKFHEVRGTSWNLSRSVPLSFVTVTQVSNLSDTSAAHPTPRCCCPTRSEEAIPRSTETRRISDAHLSLKEISLLFELSLGTRLQHCVLRCVLWADRATSAARASASARRVSSFVCEGRCATWALHVMHVESACGGRSQAGFGGAH